MASSAAQAAGFTGAIPQHYDRELGPVLFLRYAQDIARRAAAHRPRRVLETAAGTGFVTRRLRDLLPAAEITATDLNAGMLDIAAPKFRSDEAVEFRPADATALPFGDSSFDAVVCQFGVMFYPDKDASYREAARVLAPGGHYLFSVWDSHAYNPFGRIAHETVCRFLPVDPPQFYTVPFGYASMDTIKASLLSAGFDGIRFAVLRQEETLSDPEAFAHGAVFGNPLIDQIRARGGADPEQLVSAICDALVRACDGAPLPLQAIVVEARKG